MRAQRSDALRNKAALLAAADQLFAGSQAPAQLSMEDIATAAGVGKATLFRAFGSREGLIRALWETRTAPLREAVESGPPPLGPDTQPRLRILAVLDAFLVLKLDHRHLWLAAEEPPRDRQDASLFERGAYRDAHELLATLLAATGWGERADLLAHALLGAIRADLVDHLAQHRSPERMRADLAALLEALLDRTDQPGQADCPFSAKTRSFR